VEENMNILIHDRNSIENEKILKNNTEETIIISDNGKIKPCICCFGCWIKTPGQCVIKDGFDNMGELWSKCNQLIIISQCYYGCYSPFVKNVLDRSICPYQLPYFTEINGETRHPKRYKNKIEMSIHFYGKITENEKETVRMLGNKYFIFKSLSIFFYDSFEEIKGVKK
jgi:multimeric flavodoxin WrbA